MAAEETQGEFAAAVREARRPRRLEAGGITRLAYDVSGIPGASRLPRALVVLLENCVRRAPSDEEAVRLARRVVEAGLAGAQGEEIDYMPSRVLFQDFTGVPVFVDFASMRDAMVKRRGRLRQPQRCPAPWWWTTRSSPTWRAPGRGGGEPLHRGQAQPRALLVPQVGGALLRQRQDRPPRRGHLPPAQHRAVLQGRLDRHACRRGAGRRLLRHAGGDRLAHHDRKRPGRARLGRGRHRGGGRGARPADLDARAPRGGAQAHRAAARRRERHGPRPHSGPGAEGRRRRGLPGGGDGGRRRHPQRHAAGLRRQHDARVRRHHDPLPRGRPGGELPRPDWQGCGRDRVRPGIPAHGGRPRGDLRARLLPYGRAGPLRGRDEPGRPLPTPRPRHARRPEGALPLLARRARQVHVRRDGHAPLGTTR